MEFIKNKKEFLFLLLVVILFIIGILLRIFAFNSISYHIGMDEAHSLEMVKYDFKTIFTQFFQGANFLPFYSCFLKIIYSIFGLQASLLKGTSLLAGILSIFVFYFLSQKILKNKFLVICSLFVFVFNHNMIYLSTYLKPYIYDALLTMLVILATFYLREKLLNNQLSKKLIFLTIFSSIFVVYFSIPALVVLYICFALLFIDFLKQKNYSAVKKILFIAFCVGIAFLVEYVFYISQIQADSSLKSMWADDDFFFSPKSLPAINALINFTYFSFFPIDSLLDFSFSKPILYSYLVVFSFGLFNFIKQKSFMFLIIPSTILFFLCLSFLNIYPFCNRVITFLIPLFILVVFKALDNKKNVNLYNVLGVGFLIFFLFFINLSGLLFKNEERAQKYKEKVEVLSEINSDEIIISLSLPYFSIFDKENVVVLYPLEYIKNNRVDDEFSSLYKTKRKIYLSFCLHETPKEIVDLYKKKIIEDGFIFIENFDGEPFSLPEFSYYVLEKK